MGRGGKRPGFSDAFEDRGRESRGKPASDFRPAGRGGRDPGGPSRFPSSGPRPARNDQDNSIHNLNMRISGLEDRVMELQEDIQGMSELLQAFIEELRGSIEVVEFEDEEEEGLAN